MATYIPGITDYIPQVQPFKPDFNFLGNVLQFKQSKYDQNYKALSEKYGSLLNSPLSRTDNLEKRNEFFKVIDNDIKRISGMDLSLQQNVDSANKVFDSFLENKDLVYDMMFTKESQKQLQTGEGYKGTDGYWDTGIKYVNYKIQEFKNASKEDSMKITPGEYVPFVNLQNKALDVVNKMFDGKGPFGIEQIKFSPDGKYKITTTNGELLEAPLQELIKNMFVDDSNIQNMYRVKSYVDRKDYIQQNLAKFNGDPNAAEDEYFELINNKAKEYKYYAQETEKIATLAKAKKELLGKMIKKYGSTGDDGLAKAYKAAGIDVSTIDKTLDHSKQINGIIDGIYTAGADRETKRSLIDSFRSNLLLNNEINEATRAITKNTGKIDVDVDPYAKSMYDHSLKMSEISLSANLQDRNNRNNAIYKLTADMMKDGTHTEMSKRGNLLAPDNNPQIIKNIPGTSSGPEESKELERARSAKESTGKSVLDYQNNFTKGYLNLALDQVKSEKGVDPSEKAIANGILSGIMGEVKRDAEGKIIRGGWDPINKTFYDYKGNKYDKPDAFITNKLSTDYYNKALDVAGKYKETESHQIFWGNTGNRLVNSRNTALEMYQTQSQIFKENNMYIKTLNVKDDPEDKVAWETYFNGSGQIKDKQTYVKDLLANMKKYAPYKRFDAEDAADIYEDMNEEYNKIYYSSPKGIKSWSSTPELQMLGGGLAAGNGYMYNANTKMPASSGSVGLMGVYYDGLNGGMFTAGHQATLDDAEDKISDNARLAIENWVNALKNGELSGKSAKAMNATVTYMDLALSNGDYAGATIKLPQEFIDQFKAKKGQAKTWADDPDIQNGIGVYFKKDDAKNMFTETFRRQPYDYLINHKNVVIENKDGGKVTINKKNADGSITINGVLYGYEGNTLKAQPIGHTYYNDPGGQLLYDGLNALVDKMAQTNKDYVSSNFKKTYNPADLDEVYQSLGLGGGQQQSQDVGSQFNQMLQQNMQQFPQ